MQRLTVTKISANKADIRLLNANEVIVYFFGLAFIAFIAFISSYGLIEFLKWPINDRFFEKAIMTSGLISAILMMTGSFVQLLWRMFFRSLLSSMEKNMMFLMLVCLFPLGFVINYFLFLRHKT